MVSTVAMAVDYYTIEIHSSHSSQEASKITSEYKDMGFDAFTQVRPRRGKDVFITCINKFKSRESAIVFARNLEDLNVHKSFKINHVLSKREWITRFRPSKKAVKPLRLPAKTKSETLNLNPEKIPYRRPAAITDPYKPVLYKGTPSKPPVENPAMKGQKFVTTEKGLFVSIPTSRGDHWEKVPTDFDAKNAFLHFSKHGALYLSKYKLDPEQKNFKPYIDEKKFNLSGYRARNIYEKDGLLWVIFLKHSKKGLREPASASHSCIKRVFISADMGKEWSELPNIIKKDF